MNETKLSKLSRQYLVALRVHFEHGPQAGLQTAHKLGRQALAIGLDTLDLARIHEQALAALLLPGHSAITRDEMTRRAAIFFAEAVMPIEKTHRTAMEATDDLKEANVKLSRRTQDLADSNCDLKERVTQRKAAEKAFKTNGEQSSRLFEESRELQEHLQNIAHKILAAHEEDRRVMSLALQDEIVQTLLGIHVRLLALKKEASSSNENFQKEIAATQRMVEESVGVINNFASELGIHYEK